MSSIMRALLLEAASIVSSNFSKSGLEITPLSSSAHGKERKQIIYEQRGVKRGECSPDMSERSTDIKSGSDIICLSLSNGSSMK